MPDEPSASPPAVTLHPDSICTGCALFDDGQCRYMQHTLDADRAQAVPVSACSAFDAISTTETGE